MDPLGGCGQSPPFSPRDGMGKTLPRERRAKGFAFPGAPTKPPDAQSDWGNRFFRDTPISGAPLCSAFARRANSVEYAHTQRLLARQGKAAPFFRPARMRRGINALWEEMLRFLKRPKRHR